MDTRPASISSHLWRGAIALLTLQVAAVSIMRYLTGGLAAPQFILDNGFADPFLLLHVVGATAALLLGPLQFVSSMRRRFSRLHRFIGRGYVTACALGAPAGLMLALGTQAGPGAASGFATGAVLWAVFTWLGWRAALERRFVAHRAWMLRSYAMTFNAITLRLMLPMAAVLGLDFMDAYPTIAWLSWVVTLTGFELFLRRTRTRAAPA